MSKRMKNGKVWARLERNVYESRDKRLRLEWREHRDRFGAWTVTSADGHVREFDNLTDALAMGHVA